MHSKQKDVQTQEPFCLTEFGVSSEARSASQTAKNPFYFKSKSHSTRWLQVLSIRIDSQLDSELILVGTVTD